ncbi:hypothetical protein [Marinobacterium weihaiense]|uniref:Lipoprotein n=1 Tax=Marinobacterium weihaiense TaxID=2851016 RepID=A0ABS6M852_9GAMM|nr:hypothetical protein [Marinobacterium weihaiense]MBV0932467.1 hypothetical protein [Marinobacterium weihaiense]
MLNQGQSTGRFSPIRFGSLLAISVLLTACAQKQPESVAVKPEPKPEPKPVLLISDHHTRGSSDASISFTNGTDQTLQYVMFKTSAFTRAGKPVNARKSGRRNAWLRVAGPFAPGEEIGGKVWQKVWRHPNLGCFRIEGAELIFADQSVEYHGTDRFAMLNQSATRNAACGGQGVRTAAQ